jgi:hypothetical protein
VAGTIPPLDNFERWLLGMDHALNARYASVTDVDGTATSPGPDTATEMIASTTACTVSKRTTTRK